MFLDLRISLLALCSFVLLTAGCSATRQTSQSVPETSGFAVTCVGVLPGESASLVNESSSPADKKQFETGLATLDALLRQEFIGRSDIRLVSAAQYAGIMDNAPAEALSRIQIIADRVSCNAVLETKLKTFKERVGGKYSAKDPASVAFDYRLVAVPGGTVLCSGNYKETQKSVMENLYKFSTATHRGFTWVTAEELMREGLEAKFGECSYLLKDK